MENGEYSDERFVDAMVPHHQGAIEMAEVALENAEHEEVRALAEDIVSAQEAEIEELRATKRREFGTSEVPAGMGAEEMEGMGMMVDPRELADQELSTGRSSTDDPAPRVRNRDGERGPK